MPNFDAIETYSVFHPLGIVIHALVLALSAWLTAVVRSWRGWAIHAVVTILLISPVLLLLVACFTVARCDLGAGLLILLTGPLALAWLLGVPLGLLFRIGRSASPHQPT